MRESLQELRLAPGPLPPALSHAVSFPLLIQPLSGRDIRAKASPQTMRNQPDARVENDTLATLTR